MKKHLPRAKDNSSMIERMVLEGAVKFQEQSKKAGFLTSDVEKSAVLLATCMKAYEREKAQDQKTN